MKTIREKINDLTSWLELSLDEVFVTAEGEVWTIDDLEEERECGNDEPVQTAREWYDAELETA